jgi:hypothetical protein
LLLKNAELIWSNTKEYLWKMMQENLDNKEYEIEFFLEKSCF